MHATQPNKRDIKPDIKHYLLKNFLFTSDENALGEDDSLVRGGILDSTGIYELIMHIEESFGFTVPPEEMVPDNFDTIALIDRYVASKLAV